tara:strand:+ start:1174 stop:1917 length:744 start_codon:yes stop_codon:yes gene_type:complete
MKHIKEYILPDKYKGKQRGKSYKMINFARSWTKGEEDWLLMLKDKGVTNNDIAFYLDRNVTSIRRKVERLKQKVTLKYNDLHKDEKYEYNSLFLKHINPKSVLDLYAGPKSYYLNKCKSLITNDINKNYDNTYNIDALKILCKLYHDNKKFDLIDIDPFGSAYDCFDLATKMVKKGLIITFGEMGSKRYKRLDYVSKRYNINCMDDFEVDAMIDKVILIGLRNKKKLVPIYTKNWHFISRVYFEVHR